MTTRFTLTINVSAGNDGGTRASESQQVAELLHDVARKVQTGKVSESNLYDRNGVNVGNWTYSPTASS